MLKKIALVAFAATAAAQAYKWMKQQNHANRKKQHKEALQVWEGEGGNPPPPRMPGTGTRPEAKAVH